MDRGTGILVRSSPRVKGTCPHDSCPHDSDCNAFDAVNSGAGISADDFDISRLISFANTFKPNEGFRQWANHSEFMFMPILLADSASKKRTSQRLYDHLLQPVMRYLLA